MKPDLLKISYGTMISSLNERPAFMQQELCLKM